MIIHKISRKILNFNFNYRYTVNNLFNSLAPFLFFIFISTSAWAQIEITDVDNASGQSISTSTSSVTEIYGGISGPDCNSDGLGANEFCNSCTANDISCNRKRIHNDLKLTIKFKVTADISGVIAVKYGDNDATITLDTDDYERSTTGSLSKNSIGEIRIPWGQICAMFIDVHSGNAIPNTNPCETAAPPLSAGTTTLATSEITLFIGLGDASDDAKSVEVKVQLIEPNFVLAADGPHLYTAAAVAADDVDVGMDAFVAVPGDEKIYIDQLDPSPDCPDTGTSDVKKFRIFYSDVGFTDANYPSSNYADFSVDSDCDPVGDWAITGLTNGAYYHVRAAIVDAAENVAFLTDSTIYDAGGLCNDPIASDNDDELCVYAAKPDNVVGLLSEDFNCFIATATYGSGFHSFVKTLRKFRNTNLLPHRWGRNFIRWYYRVGPTWAKWISDKPEMKMIVGAALAPITGLAWFSVYYGMTGTAIMLLSLFIALCVYSRNFRQQKQLAKIIKAELEKQK